MFVWGGFGLGLVFWLKPAVHLGQVLLDLVQAILVGPGRRLQEVLACHKDPLLEGEIMESRVTSAYVAPGRVAEVLVAVAGGGGLGLVLGEGDLERLDERLGSGRRQRGVLEIGVAQALPDSGAGVVATARRPCRHEGERDRGHEVLTEHVLSLPQVPHDRVAARGSRGQADG